MPFLSIALILTVCDQACREKIVADSQKHNAPMKISSMTVDNAFATTEPWKSEVTVENSEFQDTASFAGFNDRAAFNNTKFRDDTVFAGPKLQWLGIDESQFDKQFVLKGSCGEGCVVGRSTFGGPVWFDLTTGNRLQIAGGTFTKATSFRDVQLQELIVDGAHFQGPVELTDAKVITRFTAVDSIFEEPPRLIRTHLQGEVRFDNSSFPNGLELRFADLTGATIISFDEIKIEPRNFRFNWDQLARTETRRIDVLRHTINDERDEDDKESFPRLVATYELLAAALEDHGQEEDADRVRLELETRRQEVDGDLLHGLYGVFFGYGYAPWRVTFLAIPLMLLFVLLYRRHSNTVAEILDDDVKKGNVQPHEIRPIARAAHLLFFSTAVLLGIRFQSDWIRPKEPRFLALVATEWLLGIGLYVLFFAAVKTSGFAYVKGLLGF